MCLCMVLCKPTCFSYDVEEAIKTFQRDVCVRDTLFLNNVHSLGIVQPRNNFNAKVGEIYTPQFIAIHSMIKLIEHCG